MSRLVAISLAAIVVTSVASADAQSDDAKEAAEQLFRAAEKLFEAGQYAEAADNFERAYEALPLPAIAFSAAQAYRLQYFKDRQDAVLNRSVELYQLYVKEQKEGGRIPDAVAILAELEPLLARAESRGSVGKIVREEKTGIVVTSQVKGAKASVNGSEMAAMPLPVEVKPGNHKIRVEANGYAPFMKSVDVVAGQVLAVEGELRPLPVKISVNAKAGSTVLVDGKSVGTTPLAKPIEVEAGSHFIAVTQRGHNSFSEPIVATRGERVAVDAPMRRTRQRKLSYVFLGTGAAFLLGATGAGLGALVSNNKAVELDDLRKASGLSAEQADEYNQHLDDRSERQTTALGLLGVGLAAGAVGGLLYMLDNPSPDRAPEQAPTTSTTTTVVPVATASGAGVVLTGRF